MLLREPSQERKHCLATGSEKRCSPNKRFRFRLPGTRTATHFPGTPSSPTLLCNTLLQNVNTSSRDFSTNLHNPSDGSHEQGNRNVSITAPATKPDIRNNIATLKWSKSYRQSNDTRNFLFFKRENVTQNNPQSRCLPQNPHATECPLNANRIVTDPFKHFVKARVERITQ